MSHVEIASSTSNEQLYTKISDIILGKTYSFKVVAVNAVF